MTLALVVAGCATTDLDARKTAMPEGNLCASRAAVAEALARRYGEIPISAWPTNSGTLLQIFASRSRTWSAVMIYPNGQSCLVAAGDGWEPSIVVRIALGT